MTHRKCVFMWQKWKHVVLGWYAGTPLSRGLEDLYGLLFFLKVEPYSHRFWWSRVMQGPYEAGSHAGLLPELSIHF